MDIDEKPAKQNAQSEETQLSERLIKRIVDEVERRIMARLLKQSAPPNWWNLETK